MEIICKVLWESRKLWFPAKTDENHPLAKHPKWNISKITQRMILLSGNVVPLGNDSMMHIGDSSTIEEHKVMIWILYITIALNVRYRNNMEMKILPDDRLTRVWWANNEEVYICKNRNSVVTYSCLSVCARLCPCVLTLACMREGEWDAM